MKKLLLFIIPCVASSVALGSGFQILEQGAANLGTATAGAATNANNDASAAFWNPSAFAFSGTNEVKIDGSMNVIVPHFRFHNQSTTNPYIGTPVSGNSGGNGGETALVPNMYAGMNLNDKWAITFSATAPYGLETDYEDGWVGRYHAMRSVVKTLDLNPSLVYKPLDWLALSVGASAQYVNAELTQSVFTGGPDLNANVYGDSWSGGANVGITAQYAEGGRIGVGYRSEVGHTLSGTMKVTNAAGTTVSSQPIEADLTLPNVITTGIYQRLWGDLDDFALMFDYAFTQWNTFNNLNIKNANTGTTVSYTPENWKNTSRVALGVHYYATEDVTLKLGTAWDESPVRSSEFRTARVPDSDRVWFSGGVAYNYKSFNIELAYSYIMFADADINSTTTSGGTIEGTYEGFAQVITLQVGVAW